MIKKFFAWVKNLFTKNVEIDDQKVDDYVVNNQPSVAKIYVHGDSNNVRVKGWEDHLNTAVTGEKTVITHSSEKESLDVEIPDPAQDLANSRKAVSQAPAKSLDEKLKSVELPAYAKGKVLPPSAKRKFLKQSKSGSYKASGNSGLRADYVDTTVIGSSLGTVAVASTLLTDTVETRSSACTSSYSSFGGGDSYSSYDSGSSDSGSCSCD